MVPKTAGECHEALAEDWRFHNIYSHDFGVTEEETIMFVMNGFLAPCIWLINPWYLAKRVKQRIGYGDKFMTQE